MITLPPKHKIYAWLSSPFCVPVHMRISPKTLQKAFGHIRFNVVVIHALYKELRRGYLAYHLNILPIVEHGYVFLWLSSDTIPQVVEWFSRNKLPMVETLVFQPKSRWTRHRKKSKRMSRCHSLRNTKLLGRQSRRVEAHDRRQLRFEGATVVADVN